MFYLTNYNSPIGKITLVGNDTSLIGLWIEGQKHFAKTMPENTVRDDNHKVLLAVKSWLNEYLNGKNPSINKLTLSPIGTKFQQDVWHILNTIPYGKTITYGDIAKQLATKLGKEKVSARAVGGAVGKNPISIIIPCHRVVGKNNSLTGYASGIDKKVELLKHENIDMLQFASANK